MTPEEIKNLSDIDFEPILKACLLRLQDSGELVVVKHDSYNECSLVIPYIDMDVQEARYVNLMRKCAVIDGNEIEINCIIK